MVKSATATGPDTLRVELGRRSCAGHHDQKSRRLGKDIGVSIAESKDAKTVRNESTSN